MTDITQLKQPLHQYCPIALSDHASDQLMHYLTRLAQWNQVHNLTAITEISAMIPYHLLDSLSIIPYLRGQRIIDVGTGGGLPGIPLAIACPQYQITLLDCRKKKTDFLRYITQELGLSNTEVIHHRVEDYAPSQGFSSIVSRAFSSLSNIMALTHHLYAPDGCLVAMKGRYPTTELAEIKQPYQVHPINVAGLDAERHVVLIEHDRKIT